MIYRPYSDTMAAADLSNAIRKADTALQNGWITSERHAELIKLARKNSRRIIEGYHDDKARKAGA